MDDDTRQQGGTTPPDDGEGVFELKVVEDGTLGDDVLE